MFHLVNAAIIPPISIKEQRARNSGICFHHNGMIMKHFNNFKIVIYMVNDVEEVTSL